MNVSRMIGPCGFLVVILARPALAQEPPRPEPAPPAVKAKAQLSATSNGPAHADFPVIGYLEKRDRTLTILSGPKGPLYSVKTAAGKVLCDKVSLEQLRVQAPELHQFIKSAIAGSAKGAIVDASIRAPRP
jgi:hypothetical protein